MAIAPPSPHRPISRTLLLLSRTLHIYLSMLGVVMLMFFGVTGFMLNHADGFGLEATRTDVSSTTIPVNVIQKQDKLMLVEHLRSTGVSGAVDPFDWPGEGEVFHLAFKSPRSHTDVDIDLPAGVAEITTQTRGVMGWLTRLHTAGEAGAGWRLLLDMTAILLVIASISGIVLWQSLAKRRAIGIAALMTAMVAIVLVYAMFVP